MSTAAYLLQLGLIVSIPFVSAAFWFYLKGRSFAAVACSMGTNAAALLLLAALVRSGNLPDVGLLPLTRLWAVVYLVILTGLYPRRA